LKTSAARGSCAGVLHPGSTPGHEHRPGPVSGQRRSSAVRTELRPRASRRGRDIPVHRLHGSGRQTSGCRASRLPRRARQCGRHLRHFYLETVTAGRAGSDFSSSSNCPSCVSGAPTASCGSMPTGDPYVGRRAERARAASTGTFAGLLYGYLVDVPRNAHEDSESSRRQALRPRTR
jgi:hypothetical protein